MKSTNRQWQKHLRSKGIFSFFLDRLRSHAMASNFQYESGSFHFDINNIEEDELTKAFFELSEKFPTEIYIETTNSCNLNCNMCARKTMDREQGVMSFDLLKKIVDEIAIELPYAYIHWYGIGDPLMDPQIVQRMEYAKSKGLDNTLVFTNGQLLLENDNYKKLVDSGVAHIGVDLDAFCQETYSKIRIGGEFEKTRDGIIKLHDYISSKKKRTRVEIAYQLYSGINEDNLSPFIEWCNKRGYEYKLVTMHTWAGLRNDLYFSNTGDLEDDHRGERNNPCAMLWRLFIGWNGKVSLCFQDANCQECLGDVTENSIKSIWDTTHIAKRRQHVHAIYKGLCHKCSSFTNMSSPQCFSPLYPKELLSE